LSWKHLYRLGALAVLCYIVVAVIVPAALLLSSDYDAAMSGRRLLEYIAEHRTWWIVVQTMALLPSALAIIPFLAIYPALKHLDKSWLIAGVVLAVCAQVLFMAYIPVVNGLTYLSDQYVAAGSEAERLSIAAGAEALAAMNNAYGPSEAVLALGVSLISIVMLKGVFHRAVAWLGLAATPAAIIAAAFKSTLGIAYLGWWLVVLVWFGAVGLKLYQLGWMTDGAESPDQGG
jgi:hypothetical protein